MYDLHNALAWRLTWSNNGYRGWDHSTYRMWRKNKGISGFGYVKKYGFGHEWWNFYEGFDNEYYYDMRQKYTHVSTDLRGSLVEVQYSIFPT